MGQYRGKLSNYMELSDRQRAIIVGSMLGDGMLEKRWRYPRLRFGHGLVQKEYLFWKYNEFQNLTSSQPTLVNTWHKKMAQRYQSLHFGTRAMPELMEYWNAFYADGCKMIPKNIGELLIDPLSLAVWFMDDGYKRNDCNALRLNTDSFSGEEQKQLQLVLEKNFGIMSTIHRKGKYWNLYIPRASAYRFVQIVRPYIIPSISYKIALAP